MQSNFDKMTLKEQWGIMQRASVFVSQYGTLCFHTLFLPKCAQLILVEDDTTLHTNKEAHLFYKQLPRFKTRTYSFPKEGKASAAEQELAFSSELDKLSKFKLQLEI